MTEEQKKAALEWIDKRYKGYLNELLHRKTSHASKHRKISLYRSSFSIFCD